MLILTRRIGETIIIGNDVQISVLAVKGNQMRFGIDAPKDVPVHREEIYQRIQSEKEHHGCCNKQKQGNKDDVNS